MHLRQVAAARIGSVGDSTAIVVAGRATACRHRLIASVAPAATTTSAGATRHVVSEVAPRDLLNPGNLVVQPGTTTVAPGVVTLLRATGFAA